MKTLMHGFASAILILGVSAVVGQTSDPMVDQTQEFRGQVRLIRADSDKVEKDASRVAVWLVPQDPIRPIRLTADHPNYRVVQHNKTFEPGFLVVPLGSIVDFPNLDPWFHSVFSLYRGKRFDLGLYEAGSRKQVRFDRPGISYIFCNIHSQMTAMVLTVDSEFSAISDKSGHFSISGVPPGRYLLRVWYENSTPEALQVLERPILIDSGSHTLPAISIPVTKQIPMKHKNKFGRDYDPKALAPEY